jgi:tetratricopeptide (TPR) repeat protein
MRYSIEMLEDAVRLDPNFAVAWALLARMHAVLFSNDLDRSASRREAAHEAVEAAVRLRPDLTETLLAQARYLFRIEADYEGAKKILARVREQSPNNAEAKFSLALIAKYEAHWPESFSFFQEAIALDPQNAFYREIFCETYMLARQFAVALKTCDGALDLQPGNEGALITKAIIYQALGELERADAMLAILRPTPGNAPAVSVLSYQAMLRHRYPATIALLQSQLANPAKLDSKVGVTRRWLGDLQRLSGDDASAKANYLQARDELQVVLKGQPNNAELIANIALIYAGLRDKQMAMKYAEQAIALGSKAKRPTRLTSLQQTHARIEARLGEHDQAIAALQYLLTAPGGLPPLTPALLRLDPDWDGLRADPRFQQMVATIE